MEQSDLMQEVTNRFADKFKNIARVKIKDSTDDSKREEPPVIIITLLGIEEQFIDNLNNKIPRREEGKNGEWVEYFVAPPSMFKLTYIVTPHFKTYADSLKILGSIVALMKDEPTIPVDIYDWIGNNNYPIKIDPVRDMSLERQMQLFSMLKMEYKPSLFYELTIGINSTKKEHFRRVDRRDFRAFDKNRKEQQKGKR